MSEHAIREYLKTMKTGGGGDKTTVSVRVNSTTTGEAGTQASVVNVGDEVDVALDFTIPRGAQGIQGETGPQGPKGDAGDDGRVQDVLQNGQSVVGQDGIARILAGSGDHEDLTQAEYDALTPEEKMDGTVYFITDGSPIPTDFDDYFASKDGQSRAENAKIGTVTLNNCTGTVSHNQMFFVKLESGLYFVTGRVNINNFVRTGTNPGVNITLPSFMPTPTKSGGNLVGFRAQSPREVVTLNTTTGSRTVTLTTYESFTNATNGTLTLVVGGIIVLN